ncbi:MAG: 2OG-Fe(II) oxygenase [Xanthomonadales bacterium]|jgi:hypothetical protein|nr:2OG-Fe(II) oxygenase [Xanthomonadales bacterium]
MNLSPELLAGVAADDPRALYLAARQAAALAEHAQAWAWFARAAERGLPAAATECGLYLLYGMNGDVDVARAEMVLRSAANAGHPEAAYWCVVLGLQQGLTGADRAQLAADWVMAVEGNERRAARALGICGAAHPDPALRRAALDLLELIARAGDESTQDLLARIDAEEDQTLSEEVLADIVYDDPEPPTRAQLIALAKHALTPPNASPRVLDAGIGLAVLPGVVSRPERQWAQILAGARLTPAEIVDPATGERQRHPARSNREAGFDHSVLDLNVRLIEAKMADFAGHPLIHGETLTVLCYGPGEEYRPHRDDLPAVRVAADPSGQRIVTVLAYLGAAERGGETDFPKLGIKVPSTPGDLLRFRTVDAEGKTLVNALHAGCPVLSGEKWVASLWVRERPYREF